MEIKLSAQGGLIEPFVHDGYLEGISSRDEIVRLEIRTIWDEQFTLELRGVSALVANDFRQSNIMGDIVFVTGREPDRLDLDLLYSPPHPAVSDDVKTAHEKRLDEAVSRIRSGARTLCVMSSSYGCVLVAECSTFGIVSA